MAKLKKNSFIVLIFLLLASCGGGGGDNPEGGIDGTGSAARIIASGSIESNGSEISVNNSDFDTSEANINIDGEQNNSADQLQTGQVVIIEGETSAIPEASASAANITYISNVIGPVANVDQANLRIFILDQTIILDSATVFGDGINSINDIDEQTLRISGLVDSQGNIYATRIDVITGVTNFQIAGLVEALNASSHSFEINDLLINTQSVTNLPSLANGDRVKVKGIEIDSDGNFIANSIEILTNTPGNNGALASVEGLITRFNSTEDFDVSGFPVTLNSDVVENGQLSDLSLNARIEVYGTFNTQGIIVAERIVIINTAPILFSGSLATKESRIFTIESTTEDVGLWVTLKVSSGMLDLAVNTSGDPFGSMNCTRRLIDENRQGLCYLENNQAGTWHIFVNSPIDSDYEIEAFFRRVPFRDIQVLEPGTELTLNQKAGDRSFYRLSSENIDRDAFLSILVEGLGDMAQLVIYGDNEDDSPGAEQCYLSNDNLQDTCWLPVDENSDWYIDFSSFVDKEYSIFIDFIRPIELQAGEIVDGSIEQAQGTLYATDVSGMDASLAALLFDRDNAASLQLSASSPPIKGRRKCISLQPRLQDIQCIAANNTTQTWYTLVKGSIGTQYSLSSLTQTIRPAIQDLSTNTNFEADYTAGQIVTYRIPKGEEGTALTVGLDELNSELDLELSIASDNLVQFPVCDVKITEVDKRLCPVVNDGSTGDWIITIKGFSSGRYNLWTAENTIFDLSIGQQVTSNITVTEINSGKLIRIKNVAAGEQITARLSQKMEPSSLVGREIKPPTSRKMSCGNYDRSTTDSSCQLQTLIVSDLYFLISGDESASFTISITDSP